MTIGAEFFVLTIDLIITILHSLCYCLLMSINYEIHLGTDHLIITNRKEVISYPTVHVNACHSENKQNILK